MSQQITNPTCKKCVQCETADACTSLCNTAQTYCKKQQNSDNNFSFSSCVSSGEIIGPGYFDRDCWNEAISKINSVFTKGIAPATESTISSCTDSFITADEFNRVASAADCDVIVVSDGIIYGTYYEALEDAIANLQYKSDQCDSCNIKCNATYDKCVTCNASCNSCNAECGDSCCDAPPPCDDASDEDCETYLGENECGTCNITCQTQTPPCNESCLFCEDASSDECAVVYDGENECGTEDKPCDDIPPCVDINCGDSCAEEEEGGCGEIDH